MFSEKECREIAKYSGLGEVAVRRILGSLYISTSGTSGKPLRYEIGFCLGPERRSLVKQFPEKIATAFQEYLNTCPAVVRWVGRGDFCPTKIPETITAVNLLHACRTASRLRASLFREANP